MTSRACVSCQALVSERLDWKRPGEPAGVRHDSLCAASKSRMRHRSSLHAKRNIFIDLFHASYEKLGIFRIKRVVLSAPLGDSTWHKFSFRRVPVAIERQIFDESSQTVSV